MESTGCSAPRGPTGEADTIVIANGFSCKTQIEQADTGRRALHVAQAMQMAREYGPDGYRGGPPEAPYYERRPEPGRSRRIARVALPAVAPVTIGTAAAWPLVRRR